MAAASTSRASALASLGLLAAAVAAAAGAVPGTPPGHYAAIRGIRMYFEEHGQGPVLVLLHGGAGNGEQFARQVPAFAPHFRLVVPDMCAQGRTSDRDEALTYHAMAEDVLALMDHLQVERFDVMGWSDGGNTGLDLAIHHPDRLRRLVTFGANFAPDGLEPADVAWNRTATAASFGDGAREGWTKLSPEPGHYEAAMNKILLMWRTLPRFTVEELGAIRARVLVGAGEHDVVRRDHSEALARAIPGAALWIVAGASHGAMLEQPDVVNARVLAFLTD